MINLSRNSPIAIMFGAAGFIASHVTEKLLEKGVQVVGIDDLTTGSKNNLLEASKNRSFHFIFASAEKDLEMIIPRLDYAVFCLDDNNQPSYILSFKSFLGFCMKHHKRGIPKIVLLSSVKMYDKKHSGDELREVEKLLARYASENKANARVVRLVPIYGPRMHFREEDPIVDLILAAARGEVQKELVSLDFTTRALYIDDAVNLILKALFSGATAQKIYDGALLYPIKVAEVKQVLLDPIWHEVKRFTPTELPPWPTPNLEKTQKELAWRGSSSIVTSLKHTLAFFRENPDRIPKEGAKRDKSKVIHVPEIITKDVPKVSGNHKVKSFNLGFIKSQANFFIGLILIMYALVYPTMALVFGSLSIRYHLKMGNQALLVGDFDKAEKEIEFSRQAVTNVKEVFSSVEIIKALGLFKDAYRAWDILLLSLEQIVTGSKQFNLGIKALYQIIGSVTGEVSLDVKTHLTETDINLSAADANFSESLARLTDQNLTKYIPVQVKDRLEDLQVKVNQFQKNTQSLRFINSLVEQMIALDGSKTYLVMLQNNLEINSGGGQIISLATVKFDKGKLTSINIEDKVDFTSISSINSEPDFPTNARLISERLNQITGVDLAGIISLDLSSYEQVLEVIEPFNLNGLMIDRNNIRLLVKQKIKDRKFVNQLHSELLNKILFAPKTTLGKIASALDRSIQQKNTMIFISDKAVFSTINSAGWSAHFPQGVKDEKGERSEFLSLNETNLSSVSAIINKKTIQLDSTIKNEQLNNKLTIDYLNGDDKLKFNLKIYLTAGSKLNRLNFGNKDLTQQIKSFFDYGRSVYSIDLELTPSEKKQVSLEYSNIKPLEFVNDQIKFRLDVVKQAGVGADRLEYKLNHQGPSITFSTDLSTDRSFEAILKKSK